MVRKLLWQSLFFFLVLGTLGTLLRYKMAASFLPFIRSDFLIHAHSHIAVLGWTNVAFMALILFFTFSQQALERLSLKIYFWALLIVNLGITPSFMAQGYGPVSIVFSTLSIVISIWFMVLYFRSQNKEPRRSPLYWFITTGVIFYVCSAFGLVMVAMNMAAKIGGKGLFNAGVYFYLHSQYNGWMIFVIIGSVYAYLQKRGIQFSNKQIKWQWALLTLSFLPTYLPQIYELALPTWLVVIGVIGTLLSLIAIVLFLKTTYKPMIHLITNKWIRVLYGYSMLAFFIKSVMEVGGSLPFIADMVHKNRQVVIGYLHLTLLALISTYLIFAIYQYILTNTPSIRLVTLLYVPTTFLMVVTLFFDGLLQWLHIFSNGIVLNLWLTIVSAVITIGGLILLIAFIRSKASTKPYSS